MIALRVLFTNLCLDTRTGTELYIRDVVLELLRRGHSPVVYTPRLGVVAEDIKTAGVPVVNNLSELTFSPDIIHGHHRYETVAALIRFRDTPTIYMCHDQNAWQDKPPIHPGIRRYLAVDYPCRDRLLGEGISEEKIQVVLNFVDLKRFQPRPSLPARPEKVLLFSNYARTDTHLPAVQEACARVQLKLDVVGSGVNRSISQPEEILGRYDIVIAKAKAAIEAMAVGAAVILCDYKGLGQMVTSANFDRLKPLNFGQSTFQGPVTPEGLLREMARYNAQDAVKVSGRIRAEAGMERAVDNLVEIYHEVIDEHKGIVPGENGDRAAVVFFHEILPLRTKLENVQADNKSLINKLAAAEEVHNVLQEKVTNMKTRVNKLRALEHTFTFRIRKRFRKVPGLVPLVLWWENFIRKNLKS